MRITIVGAGAIGASMGAWMLKGGEDITFVDKWEVHVEALNRKGLTVHMMSGDFTVPAKAILPSQLSGPLELVFISTKSQHTVDAIAEVKPHLTRDSIVVSMQNGQDNPRTIAQHIGASRTIGGFVDFSGALVDPGEIEVPAIGDFYIGELDGAITPRLRQIQAKCSLYGQTFMTDNIWGYLWTKNCMLSTYMFQALADTSMAQAMSTEENLRVHAALMGEAISLARTVGISLENYKGYDPTIYLPKAPEETTALLETLKANNARTAAAEAAKSRPTPSGYVFKKKASGLWWDLTYRKRKSEADAVFANMWLPKAEAYGVDMSLSAHLVKMINEIEEGKRRIASENYKEMYQRMKELGKDLP